MATPLDSPKHDLGSLRIHEAERKSGSLGKRLALFFGLLVLLGGLSGGIYAFWNQKPIVEVAVVQKPTGSGGREALLTRLRERGVSLSRIRADPARAA